MVGKGKMNIRLLVTGGTFDKEYNEIDGSLFFKDTHTPEMLQLGRCLLPIKIENLMMIDSLEMSTSHRESILQACLNCSENKILITHGTDTMEITAEFLSAKLAGTEKVVVLTGAMIPYKFGSSDGLFNLGSAIAFCQTLPAGVFIAMNGRVFPAGKVTKDKSTGVFREKK